MSWRHECKIKIKNYFGRWFRRRSKLADNIDEPAFLCECATDFEGNVVAKLLEANGIPVEMVPKGAGGYMQIMMGTTNFGVHLFVPSRALQTAKDILNAKIEEEPQ